VATVNGSHFPGRLPQCYNRLLDQARQSLGAISAMKCSNPCSIPKQPWDQLIDRTLLKTGRRSPES